MKFGEKCKTLRNQLGLTQVQVAQQAGIGRRTYIDYENSGTYPKKRQVYKSLADIFGCDINYLLTEDEEFTESAGARSRKQAKELVSELGVLFAGGTLSEQEKDTVMRTLQNIYWETKKNN